MAINSDHPVENRLRSIKYLCRHIYQRYGQEALILCIESPNINFYPDGRSLSQTPEVLLHYTKQNEVLFGALGQRPQEIISCLTFALRVSTMLKDDRFKLHGLVLADNLDMLYEQLRQSSSTADLRNMLSGPSGVAIFGHKEYSAAKFARELGLTDTADSLKWVGDRFIAGNEKDLSKATPAEWRRTKALAVQRVESKATDAGAKPAGTPAESSLGLGGLPSNFPTATAPANSNSIEHVDKTTILQNQPVVGAANGPVIDLSTAKATDTHAKRVRTEPLHHLAYYTPSY